MHLAVVLPSKFPCFDGNLLVNLLPSWHTHFCLYSFNTEKFQCAMHFCAYVLIRIILA